MNKPCFFCLLFLLQLTKTIAQDHLPTVYEITSDTALHTTLPHSYWQYMEDREGKLKFEEVSRPPVAGQFQNANDKKLVHNPKIHGYWFRYILKNTMDHDAKICLGDSSISEIPFFSPQDEQSDYYLTDQEGKVIHQVNGFLTPWSELDGLKGERLIPILIKPGQQLTIYRRICNSYRYFASSQDYDFWIGFSSTEKTFQNIYTSSEGKYFNAIHNSFIVGVLLFAAIFIYLFFIIVREKVYLYFSLYLFSLALGRFNINAEMYQVFFREHPLIYVSLFQLMWFLSTFMLLHFIRHLLHTKQFLPKWDQFLVVLNIVNVITYLIFAIASLVSNFNFFWNGISGYVNQILVLSIPVTFFLSLKRFRANKVLTYVILPLQCIWGIFFLVFNYRTSLSSDFLIWIADNWHSLESILLSGLVISFSWVLLHRFDDLRKQMAQKELEREMERTRLIEKQKEELEEQVMKRTAELKQSLDNLKATQAQLIQSEKMASLGELTAGIAHEIQNPLNFVNNFSGLNDELSAELLDALRQGNIQEAQRLAETIRENEKKIALHGSRADNIVKGMLQHSRGSTGQKEETDINKLCDEYLRLSYYGMRVKDGNFKVNLETHYDTTIGNIMLMKQDFGRVLLNLFNNGFYAIREQARKSGESFKGELRVITEKYIGGVRITVQDNGVGIPESVRNKIFQPFFTTKPAGQGTGLGLSLSYDIIKAHGGEIKLETPEGGLTSFLISLPA